MPYRLKITICIFAIGLGLGSCAFNQIFLIPTVVDQEESLEMELRDGGKVIFDSLTFQPTFRDSLNQIVQFGYEIESFTFLSKSGNKLNGWYLKPPQKADITVLHFHGNAGFVLSQFKAIDPLLKESFQVFLVDYSGFGFSEGKAKRKQVLLDGESALTYVKSRYESQQTKLILYGQSLGGHLAAVVGSRNQNEIDGMVLEGAFASHSDIAAESVPVLSKVLVREMYSGKEALETYRKPLLIIHSSEDETVPFRQGQRLFDHANEPKEFYEIEGRHICGPRLYQEEIAAKIRQMLDEQ